MADLNLSFQLLLRKSEKSVSIFRWASGGGGLSVVWTDEEETGLAGVVRKTEHSALRLGSNVL